MPWRQSKVELPRRAVCCSVPSRGPLWVLRARKSPRSLLYSALADSVTVADTFTTSRSGGLQRSHDTIHTTPHLFHSSPRRHRRRPSEQPHLSSAHDLLSEPTAAAQLLSPPPLSPPRPRSLTHNHHKLRRQPRSTQCLSLLSDGTSLPRTPTPLELLEAAALSAQRAPPPTARCAPHMSAS